jgi:hypothetical protein
MARRTRLDSTSTTREATVAIDPFSALGTIWTVGTSVVKVFQRKDEDKKVDRDWLAASGFDKVCADKGIKLAWAREDRVETLKAQGYHVVYEEDGAARVRYRIINRDVILMGKAK